MNKIYIVSLLFLFLSACDNADLSEKTDNQQPDISADNILAKVNGVPVTESQLDWAMQRTLGENAVLYANQKLSEKMLQSLIASRSMALLAEKQLDKDELALLAEKVRSYREELLVKQFLQANTTVEPVTTVQVQEYYANNPQEFGADLLKEFEIILSVGKLQAKDKVELLKKLESASEQKDWQLWAKQLSDKSHAVSYKKAKSKLSLLKQPIKKLVSNTASGNTSELHFGEQLIIIRVINETKLPAKPLSEVSREIRTKLAPVNMKKAVKEASKLAKKQVEVELFSDN